MLHMKWKTAWSKKNENCWAFGFLNFCATLFSSIWFPARSLDGQFYSCWLK